MYVVHVHVQTIDLGHPYTYRCLHMKQESAAPVFNTRFPCEAHISDTIVSTCVQEENAMLKMRIKEMEKTCASLEVRNSMLYCYYGNHSVVQTYCVCCTSSSVCVMRHGQKYLP